MADTYDVIVIGAGAVGENAAGRAANAGLKVAAVESNLVGGECSYWACMPSKALLRPGEALQTVRRVPGAREAVTGDVDVKETLERRDAMTSNWDDKHQVKWIEGEGVDLIRGFARLAGEKTVEVETESGTRTLEGTKAVVLATGSRAAIPPVEGLRDIRTWDNTDITAAKEVPRRLLVLGGGVVGVEMAQAWKWLGAEEVTIVELFDRILAAEEPFAGEELKDAFEEMGIRVLTEAKTTKAAREADDAPVTLTFEDGQELTADEILVATGRTPNSDDLGLENVGLEPEGFIETDDQLRVRGVDGDWLYAVGDVNGRALLTHMGKYQARLAADHIAGKDVRAWADHEAVPRVVFTEPGVAAAGLTEAQAREQGLNIRTVSYGTGATAGSALLGEGVDGTSQIIVDTDREVIVGATFTGPVGAVSELLHSATVAIAGEVPLETLWHAVPSFPTVSEVWLRLLESYGL